MKRLKATLKTKEDVSVFIDWLIGRTINQEPISDNSMVDGFMIATIYCNSKDIAHILLNEEELPPMTDNRIQQLEKSIMWIINNEDELVKWFNPISLPNP